MSTQIKGTPVPGIPEDLAGKGWGLFLNENARFRARNDARDLETGPCPAADDAIDEARNLDVEFEEAEAIAAEAAGPQESEVSSQESEADEETARAAAIARFKEEAGGHEWRKSCLVGQKGGYDTYKCKNCEATAKRYGVSWPPVPDKKKWAECPAAKPSVEAEVDATIEEAKASAAMARTEEVAPREKRPTVTTLLAVSMIRTDGGTQMREALNMHTVAEYAEAMLEGDEFPPVDVFHDMSSGDYWLGGGFHRHAARVKAGLKEILANVHDGSLRDALIFATGENARHGLPRTNAEKTRAVTVLLRDPEWTKKADSVIGKQAGVSQPFVGGIREDLELKTVISPQPRREGADGVVRDVTHIGSTRAEETADDRQTTLADIGIDLPERESEPPASAGGETKCRVCGCTDDSPCAGGCAWVPGEDRCTACPDVPFASSSGDNADTGEIVKALERHGGVLYRGQLEEMNFSYAAILNAVSEGFVAQPETGKFTLPDHKPQPGGPVGSKQEAEGRSEATGSAGGAKPKPSLEEIARNAKAPMLTVSFTWMPNAMKGKVTVAVNTTTDSKKTHRVVVEADEVRGFSQQVMNIIFQRLSNQPVVVKRPRADGRSAAERAKARKTLLASKRAAKKPAKKSATKKARKR